MNDVTINVLGYRENGDWIAHALEMDLVGVGDSFEEAIEALNEFIEAQVSFALYKKDPSLSFHDAPIRLFDLFSKVREIELRRLVAQRHVKDSMQEFRAGGVPVPQDIEEGDFAVACSL